MCLLKVALFPTASDLGMGMLPQKTAEREVMVDSGSPELEHKAVITHRMSAFHNSGAKSTQDGKV